MADVQNLTFFLYEIVNGRDSLPITGIDIPDEFLFANISDTTKPETLDDYRERLAKNVIMFTDRDYEYFSPPGMTGMYSGTQIGIVETDLHPLTMKPNGLVVEAFRVRNTKINDQDKTIGVIGHLQGGSLTKEEANEKLGYLQWRQILIFFTEQLVYFFNHHHPMEPIDYLAIGQHPKSPGKNGKAASKLGYWDVLTDKSLKVTDTDTGRFYIKSTHDIDPHDAIQSILESRFQKHIKRYGLHPDVQQYLEANSLE